MSEVAWLRSAPYTAAGIVFKTEAPNTGGKETVLRMCVSECARVYACV